MIIFGITISMIIGFVWNEDIRRKHNRAKWKLERKYQVRIEVQEEKPNEFAEWDATFLEESKKGWKRS